ncbi:helical backbone metal receptor [Massilia sp. W12]|uniref:helical backbone metal receptor n=1 Tax=Massilia sp. W12 TaxID=3126507 RepID=UPI0030CCE82B
MDSIHAALPPNCDALGLPHPSCQPGLDDVRIVSLVPSLTELLFALGLGPYIVGRTGFCMHPRRIVKSVAKVGGTKDVNLDKIRRLAPTHLLVNIDENEKPCVEQLAQFIPHVLVTHPCTLHDNFTLYRFLGEVFSRQRQAENLCRALQRGVDALPAAPALEEVLYCIWRDPWMSIGRGTYISHMLSLIGWQSWQPPVAPGEEEKRYPVFSWEQVAARPPARILLSSEPYRFELPHAHALQQQTGLPVQLVDGEMFSWFGSRAVYGVEYLRALRAAAL